MVLSAGVILASDTSRTLPIIEATVRRIAMIDFLAQRHAITRHVILPGKDGEIIA